MAATQFRDKGKALLNGGRYREAVAVPQHDLVVNPSNGWAIAGLQTAFKSCPAPPPFIPPDCA